MVSPGGFRAVLAGGAGSIGFACAHELAERGAEVALIGRSAEKLDAAVAALKEKGHAARGYVGDAESPATLAEAVTRAAREMGGLDVAVYGIAHEEHGSARDLTIESVDRSLRVTALGGFAFARAAAESMAQDAASRRCVIVISSLHAVHPIPNAIGYNMGQAALTHMARSLAHEYAPSGVRVNVIHPGWIDTPHEQTFNSPTTLEGIRQALPLSRFGTAKDVAAIVGFLSDPAASYVAGAVWAVDGGLGVAMSRLPGI